MMHGTPMGAPIVHKGKAIQVTFSQPDFMCYVDERRIGDYWTSVVNAHGAGVRHIDQLEKEAAKAAKGKAA